MKNIHEFAAHYGLDPADQQTLEDHREYSKQLAIFRQAMRDQEACTALASQKEDEGGLR